jgi:hypothetical protein
LKNCEFFLTDNEAPGPSLPLSSILLLPAQLLAQRDPGRVVPEDRPIHVVAFGDFWTGNSLQKALAGAIALPKFKRALHLALTMSDNFYFCGLPAYGKWRITVRRFGSTFE